MERRRTRGRMTAQNRAHKNQSAQIRSTSPFPLSLRSCFLFAIVVELASPPLVHCASMTPASAHLLEASIAQPARSPIV